ncbi:hypothetical protein HT594_00100 [Phenacoccus solenopsis nudivirus]|nr:hypothetical protein HT594_00100 [Phenacoccus solenopsis nudivirus]
MLYAQIALRSLVHNNHITKYENTYNMRHVKVKYNNGRNIFCKHHDQNTHVKNKPIIKVTRNMLALNPSNEYMLSSMKSIKLFGCDDCCGDLCISYNCEY